jgi:carotenoid 1,2-hydratase
MDGIVQTAGRAHADTRILSRGRQRPSGTGPANGGALGEARGGGDTGRPRFDAGVPLNGYHWWYVDALSDDCRFGLSVIAFIGSAFSPYYKWARRGGEADPENHCAINVALYGDAKRWAMTERGRGLAARSAEHFKVGPSSLRWDGGALVIDIAETAMPIPFAVRGTVRLMPEAFCAHTEVLDAAGHHRWRPICPNLRVEASFESPGQDWSGTGYLDSNWGDVPLDQGFASWHWSRAPLKDGAAILYDMRRSDGSGHAFALKVGRGGEASRVPLPKEESLPKTGWRISRATRSDGPARVAKTLEDTPFYARSLIASRLLGEDTVSVHESISFDRFRLPIVQAMLPFRMPRRG